MGVHRPGDEDHQALLPQHLEKLASSAVTQEVIAERGYWSAEKKVGLEDAGFGPSQRRPPALIIPLYGVTGEIVGHQARPDEPRAIKGRVVKYETQVGQRMTLDVPPRARRLLGDPDVPLFITEGPIKGDALAAAGAAVVALLGVWSWRGTNEFGGTTVLAEFEYIHLKHRQVFICFDSDVMLNPHVHDAMARLSALLATRGAMVLFCYLPSGEHGTKVGVDDFLATGHTLADLIATASPILRANPDSVTDEAKEEALEVDPEFADESGAELLDEIDRVLSRYVVFPSDRHRWAVVLWIAHTHAIDAFDDTPRLQIKSAEKRSGKSRLLELIDHFARQARLTTSMSTAYLFRSIEESTPTLLVDEADTIWGRKADKSHEELRGLINAGFRRGATVGRVVGEGVNLAPQEFSVFSPVALAGIGDLPDTITDRAVLVTMRRRSSGEQVHKLRRRELTRISIPLYARLSAWANRNIDALSELVPAMPTGIEDRAADVWEPLIAVADTVGGSWPERARQACVTLNAEREEAEQSWGVKLLADCRTVFESTDADRLTTADLLRALSNLDESPWEELTARKLSWGLRPYGIKPTSHRFPGHTGTAKGYQRTDFEDAWNRYLQPPPASSEPEHAEHAEHGDDSSPRITQQARDVPAVPDVPPPPAPREQEWTL